MSYKTTLAFAALCLGHLGSQAPANAQEQAVFSVCESQQELEQVISSEGTILPDGCRTLTVSSLQSNGEELCLLDLSSSDNGVLDQIRDAAVSQQWWVRCADLLAAGR